VAVAKAAVENQLWGSRRPFGATTLAFGELSLTYEWTPHDIGTKQHLLPLSTSPTGAWGGAHLWPVVSTMGGGIQCPRRPSASNPGSRRTSASSPWEGRRSSRGHARLHRVAMGGGGGAPIQRPRQPLASSHGERWISSSRAGNGRSSTVGEVAVEELTPRRRRSTGGEARGSGRGRCVLGVAVEDVAAWGNGGRISPSKQRRQRWLQFVRGAAGISSSGPWVVHPPAAGSLGQRHSLHWL
jgi:hypothetical protein